MQCLRSPSPHTRGPGDETSSTTAANSISTDILIIIDNYNNSLETSHSNTLWLGKSSSYTWRIESMGLQELCKERMSTG